MNPQFDYHRAFVRNLGWLTENEQAKLRGCKVAIAGMGGVGGGHLVTLSRLGVGQFHVADFDKFEVHNFNRQYGANMNTVGREKAEVMAEAALAINPEIKIKTFKQGIKTENLDEFLDGVNLFVDGLDISALDIRREVAMRCDEKNIPVISIAPLGMGAALLNFLPGKMNFDQFFGYKGKSEEEKFIHLIMGVAPSFLYLKALVDRNSVNARNRQGPSTAMGCMLASGILGTEALKILLNRGPIRCAPHGFHFDAYSYRIRRTWMPFGYLNPLFQLGLLAFKLRLKFKNKN